MLNELKKAMLKCLIDDEARELVELVEENKELQAKNAELQKQVDIALDTIVSNRKRMNALLKQINEYSGK